MAITLNKTDCTSSVGGTGTQGCQVRINFMTRFLLLKDYISFDLATDTFDQALIDGVVQDMDMIILPEHFSPDPQQNDTVYEESPSGGKIPVRNGRYEFLPMYDSGECFNNAAASIPSKGWSLFMIDFDDQGNSRLWGEQTADGKLKGFNLELVYAENKTFNDGSTATKLPLRLLFSASGTAAMRTRVSYLSSGDAIDFAALDGINNVNLEAATTTAADLRIDALISCDNSTSILSNTADTNWRIFDTAAPTVPVTGYAVAVTNGQYSITGLPAATYTVQWYDETNEKGIVAVNGSYYSSDTITVTLV